MDCNSISVGTGNDKSLSSNSTINWDWLDNFPLDIRERTNPLYPNLVSTTTSIPQTRLSCRTGGTKEWKNRVDFIKKVVQDILESKCSKDDPFVLISQGADRLLVETLIGEALIRNGFYNLHIYLVEITFNSKNPEFQKLATDFRTYINSLLLNKGKQPLHDEAIRFFKRAPQITKYKHFPANPNVALIESFPPYGKYWLPSSEQTLENIFMGNCFVSPNEASALTILPTNYVDTFNNQGITCKEYTFLPLIDFSSFGEKQTYFNWGCKIHASGEYSVTFFGGDVWASRIKLQGNNPKEDLPKEDPREFFKNELTNLLKHAIAMVQKGDRNRLLTQEEKTTLLKSVESGLFSLTESNGFKIFYMADYSIDREELLSWMSQKAGYHYREAHSMKYNSHDVVIGKCKI